MENLKVLAVADPAVSVYIDKGYHILEDFQDKDIKVQFDIVPWENYFDTMMQVFKGNAAYDIVMVAGHLWLKDFVDKGYLAPISYDFEDILPIIAEEMTCEGKTYLSPSFCDGHMIVYRNSILKEVLGTLPKEIITVDELIEIVEKLYHAGYETPIAIKAHESEILLDALPYLRNGSDKDIYVQGQGRNTCHIKEMAKGLDKYLKLKAFAPKDAHMYGNDEIKEALIKEQVVMATTWSGQLGVITKGYEEREDLGYATFDTAWNVTWSFAITNMSKQKDKAEKLLAYLRSKQVDSIVGAYCGAPIRKSNYIEGMSKFPWYKVQLRMIEECAKPLASDTKAGEKNNLLYEAIYHIFTGKISSSVALNEVQEKVNSL